jgi:glycosyltransferase involved in cell wall biosynthesis
MISCIIPAYNVTLIPKYNLEIIVVDDGSSDKTSDVVSRFTNVKLIHKNENLGKSAAVAEGVRVSIGDLIMLIDADLKGLKKADFEHLIEPVINRKADVALSLRRNTTWFWRLIRIDYLSGERILPQKIFLDNISDISKLQPFGLEVFLNRKIIENHLRISVIDWPGVLETTKFQKIGYIKGFQGYIKMFIQIFKTVSLLEAIYQTIYMKRLSVIV